MVSYFSTVEDDPLYPRKKAILLLKRYADLNEHAINMKTEAMVVTRSRLHAVRYKLALDKLIKEKKLRSGRICAEV